MSNVNSILYLGQGRDGGHRSHPGTVLPAQHAGGDTEGTKHAEE